MTLAHARQDSTETIAQKNVVPHALVMCVISKREFAQSVVSVAGGTHSVMRPAASSVSKISVLETDNATFTLAVLMDTLDLIAPNLVTRHA